MVALFQRFHTRANVNHHAGAFMAQNGGENAFRVGTRQGVVIGVANTCCLDLNQYFTLFRAVKVNRFNR